MKRKILVIEDERTTLNSIVEFLLSEGFDAIGAENGRDGIELAQKHLPALIICDILMPELDGYDVLTYLQQDRDTASIPFIFLTATTDSSSFRLGMEMGADDYLRKPVTSAELRAAIASRLRKQEVTMCSYSPSEPLTLEQASDSSDRLQEYSNAQSSLFDFLLQGVKPSISRLNSEISEFKSTLTDDKQQEHLSNIEQEFARLLAVVNQVSELHQILTPENTKILTQLELFNAKSQH